MKKKYFIIVKSGPREAPGMLEADQISRNEENLKCL